MVVDISLQLPFFDLGEKAIPSVRHGDLGDENAIGKCSFD
jgi:hypothetical protein